MYEKIYDTDNLYRAWLEIQSVSSWKERTQRYAEDIVFHLARIREGLINNTLVLGGVGKFLIRERGKERLICSYDVDTRIVVRSLIDNILMPAITPKLIYDNSASVKGKGVQFHRDRIITHLQQFYRLHGNKGYILTIDFKKFFDNIDHELLKQMFAKVLKDDRTTEFVSHLIDLNTFDISCLSREYQEHFKNNPFDSVWYRRHANVWKCDGSNILRRGVSIGGQLSQIAGVFFPSDLDQYIKTVRGERFYARYMDDLYIIHEDKEYLWNLYKDILAYCERKKIFINKKKTHIIPLSRPFTILKIQYKVQEDGDIMRSPKKETFKRERHAIKKFSQELETGETSKEDIYLSFKSWKGNVSKFDCKKSVMNTEKYFIEKIGECVV